MSDRLEKLGLEFEFFEAVDGHAFDALSAPEYDGVKRRRYFGRDLSAGEIGCLMSHRAAYQKMVSEGVLFALILEDDTHFKSEFPDILQNLMDGDIEWDMVRFLDRKKVLRGPHRILKPLVKGYELIRIRAVPGGAYGYLLSKHAAETLLSHTERNWLQIDVMHGRCWETGLNVVATKPSPVRPDMDIPSTIGDVRFDKIITVTGLVRLFSPFYRFLFKIGSSLSIRAHYWRLTRWDRRHWKS